MGEYIKQPQASAKIDFILGYGDKFSDVKTALRNNGFTPLDKAKNQFVIQSQANCQWDVDFLFTSGDELECTAIKTANRVEFFGIENVRLVNSVYLAGMLALSADEQHEIDLHNLLCSNAFEVNTLLATMKDHLTSHAESKILQGMAKIKQSGMDENGHTETWEEYVNRRAHMSKLHIKPTFHEF